MLLTFRWRSSAAKDCCRPKSLPIATGSAAGNATLRNCLEGEVLSDLHEIAPGPKIMLSLAWAPRVEWSVAHCCSGRLEAVPSRSLVAICGKSLAWVQPTRQGHVIGAAGAEIEFPEQFIVAANVRGPCQG